MDPFATLGIARSYRLDLAAVERKHRELSRALHPDAFVGAGPSERRAALAKAVEANEALRIVRDPILRAEALLALSGMLAGEDAADAHAMAPEFLMDMLEQREALAEAKRARDLDSVRKMAGAIEARVQAVDVLLSERFASGEFEGVAGKLGEMKFYRRFLDEVSAIEDELAA
jgi:molecular chaperone HscB